MILITGASGFIGKHLIARFKRSGKKIVPLYHSGEAILDDDMWALDLTNPDHMIAARSATAFPKTVVHLAGYVEIILQQNPKGSSHIPLPGRVNISRLYNSNVCATANLLEFCLKTGVHHLIYASSQAVYGMPKSVILTEESPCVPFEYYGASKLCGENLLHLGASQGLSITVLRFPGVFGEVRKSGVVFQFCRSAVRSKKIKVTAEYPLPLDIIHIEDLLDALENTVELSEQKWLCLNIASGEPCSLNLLADAIVELVPGCKVEYSKVPQPIVQIDTSKAKNLLGWEAIPRQVRLKSMLESVRHAV